MIRLPLHRIRESFVVRISLTLLALILVLALLFDLLLIRLQREAYEQENIKHGLSLVRLFAQSVRVAVFSENVQDLIMPVASIMDQADVVETEIFNQHGTRLYRLKKTGNQPSSLPDNRERLATIMGMINKSGEIHWQTTDSFVFWWPVSFNTSLGSEESLFFEQNAPPQSREVIGYAALVISKQSFSAGVRRILVNTGAVVVCFLALGIAVSFLVVHRMTRPLSQILQKLREDTGVTGQGDDLSLLSETYGGMVLELERAFATIKELKDGLELKVIERTRELSARQQELEDANLKLSETLNQLRQAQQQLVQSEKMAAMGQMVAGVAHEINNSINFISGALPSVKRLLEELKQLLASCQVLAAKGAGVDPAPAGNHLLQGEPEFAGLFDTMEQLLANIEEGTSRATRIIKDLKIFGRQGTAKFNRADLHAVIDSIFPFIDAKLLRGVEIRREFGRIEPVSCLVGRVSQVFLNIIDNGLQAMAGGGVLTIRSWQQGEHVHISFRDTGCGIEPAIMGRIFDPFFTTKEVGQGTGLGLGICYDIVRQHGGEIRVESTVSQGSVFEVILPRDHEASTT